MKTIRAIFAVLFFGLTLAAEFAAGWFIWLLTKASHEGRLQQLMWKVGDGRGPSFFERCQVNAVFIPFLLYLAIAAWLAMKVMNKLTPPAEEGSSGY